MVVGQSGTSSGDVYVKGAPECMRDICHPDSCECKWQMLPNIPYANLWIAVPVDYEELLSFYTHRGFRVIACATKHIDKLSWSDVQRMKRPDAESNLEFLGFIIFENKLKDPTTAVIDELNDASIRQVMCTGDNILTAISVARECNLIDRTAHCFIPHFLEGRPSRIILYYLKI